MNYFMFNKLCFYFFEYMIQCRLVKDFELKKFLPQSSLRRRKVSQSQ